MTRQGVRRDLSHYLNIDLQVFRSYNAPLLNLCQAIGSTRENPYDLTMGPYLCIGEPSIFLYDVMAVRVSRHRRSSLETLWCYKCLSHCMPRNIRSRQIKPRDVTTNLRSQHRGHLHLPCEILRQEVIVRSKTVISSLLFLPGPIISFDESCLPQIGNWHLSAYGATYSFPLALRSYDNRSVVAL